MRKFLDTASSVFASATLILAVLALLASRPPSVAWADEFVKKVPCEGSCGDGCPGLGGDDCDNTNMYSCDCPPCGCNYEDYDVAPYYGCACY